MRDVTLSSSYLNAWKCLDEQEQWLFEGWLAGTIPNESYVARWRMIDRAFAALEAKRMGAVLQVAA